MISVSRAEPPSSTMAAWVREVAAAHDTRIGPTTPVVPLLAEGIGPRPATAAQLYSCAGIIVKLHGVETNHELLARRLLHLDDSGIEQLWIQPLARAPLQAPGKRLATVWPRVEVLTPTDRVPWAEIGELLARLHQLPVVDPAPPFGGPTRLARAISYLRNQDTGLDWLADLGENLAAELAPTPQPTLTHGDFHLGQLGRSPSATAWQLLDADDFGVGDPAWDLARPAGFWAAGLLSDADWAELLSAYRRCGGPAVAAEGDPWPSLELPARAAVVIAAVQQLRAVHSQDTEGLLVSACWRMHYGCHDSAD